MLRSSAQLTLAETHAAEADPEAWATELRSRRGRPRVKGPLLLTIEALHRNGLGRAPESAVVWAHENLDGRLGQSQYRGLGQQRHDEIREQLDVYLNNLALRYAEGWRTTQGPAFLRVRLPEWTTNLFEHGAWALRAETRRTEELGRERAVWVAAGEFGMPDARALRDPGLLGPLVQKAAGSLLKVPTTTVGVGVLKFEARTGFTFSFGTDALLGARVRYNGLINDLGLTAGRRPSLVAAG